jgi:hypothetical protein
VSRGLGTAERLDLDAALEDAFEPLRAARTSLSPLRVRAAVRWGRGATPRSLRWARLVARASEMSVAAGMTAILFIGAFGSASLPAPDAQVGAAQEIRDASIYPVARVSAPLTDERYIRWLRIDRYIPLQDWLDPMTVRPAPPTGLVPPSPRSDSGSAPGLF